MQGTVGSSPDERQNDGAIKPRASVETARFGRSLWTLGLVTLALYCLPFYLTRRPDFDRLSAMPYSLPLNYAFKTAGQNADVVLFGDSTLLHGVDPSQMSRELGVKVLNLPNTASTLLVMNDLSLRRYLETNRPPRLIVFYFAAWDFDYEHSPWPLGTYEGREVLAHQGTALEILKYAIGHPTEALEFPFQFYLASAPLWKMFQRPYGYTGEQVARTGGHFSNLRNTAVTEDCEFPRYATDHLHFDSVKELGNRYATQETQVLYFVAPVPGCHGADAVVKRAFPELPAAAPKELPVAMFGGDPVYLHPTEAAVPEVTENLIEALRPMLAHGAS